MSRRSGNANRTRGVAASSLDTGPTLFDMTTCEASAPTLPALTSYAAGSPAKTCLSLGKALASQASVAVCGSSSRASLAFFDRASSSWRTSQLSCLGGWTSFSETFPKRGMMRSGSIFAPPTWERLIDASDSSSLDGAWATPRAEERQQRNSADSYVALSLQVKNWPTPTREDGESARRRKNAQGGASLTEVAAPRLWPTPSVGDVTGGRSVPAGTTTTGQTPDGRKVQMGLQTVVRSSVWPTPRASPNENRQTKLTPSQIAGTHGLSLAAVAVTGEASTKETAGGSLNPDFVEELMGFPKGWTRTDGPPAPAKRSAPTKRRG